jgi:adenosylcobinamide-phosphate synthase
MIELLMIVMAVIIDVFVGDPPNALHPVAWMGWVIGRLESIGLRLAGRGAQFAWGVFLTLFAAGLFGGAVWVGFHYLAVWTSGIGRTTNFIYPIIGALALKATFTISGLRDTAKQIRELLDDNDLDKVRFELRALVSRDTSKLSKPQMVSAAVESVAEGLCDSVVAPLFYFVLFGLPGAFVYRAVNTADAMIGYRGRHEYLGKFAARLDDVLNFIPARLAALVLIWAAWLRAAGGRTLRTAVHEHRKTASPNAGWPMAAMAGALDVKLEKPGHYQLGSGKGKLDTETIKKATWLFTMGSGMWVFVCLVWGGLWYAL